MPSVLDFIKKPIKEVLAQKPAISASSPDAGYYGTTTSRGYVFGPSAEHDPYSGRPFIDYRNPGDTSTTTDRTRVDTPFNPMVPAPRLRDEFYNTRMPDTVSSRVRKELGATKNDQLDHNMPLALSGSNDSSNLSLLLTEQNQAFGKLEKALQEDVKAGRISLFQAQIKDAKNKGLPLPFTASPLAQYQADAAAANKAADEANSVSGILKNTIKAIPGTIKDFFTPGKSSAAETAPSIVKTTEYRQLSPLDVEGQSLDVTIKKLNTKSALLDSLEKKIDPNDQASIAAFNQKLDEYNKEAKLVQTHIKDFNKKATNKFADSLAGPLQVGSLFGKTANSTEQQIAPTDIEIKMPFSQEKVKSLLGEKLGDTFGQAEKAVAEFPERIVQSVADIYNQVIHGGVKDNAVFQKGTARVSDAFNEAGDIANHAQENGWSSTESNALGTLYGVSTLIADLVPFVSVGAKGVLTATRYDKPLEDALFRLGLNKETSTISQWARNTQIAADNIIQTGDREGLAQLIEDYKLIGERLQKGSGVKLNKAGKFLQDVAKKIETPLRGGPGAQYNLARPGEESLPGYREKPFNPFEEMQTQGQAGFAGNRPRPKEAVGFGEEPNQNPLDFIKRPVSEVISQGEQTASKALTVIPKDLEPLAAEAKKYKSAEEFKASITPKQYREYLNEQDRLSISLAKDSNGSGPKGNLKPNKRLYGDYLYAQDRGMFDAQLADIHSGTNSHSHQDLTDFYTQAVGETKPSVTDFIKKPVSSVTSIAAEAAPAQSALDFIKRPVDEVMKEAQDLSEGGVIELPKSVSAEPKPSGATKATSKIEQGQLDAIAEKIKKRQFTPEDISKVRTHLSISLEALQSNLAKKLTKYAGPDGTLGEVTGKGTSYWSRHGDKIATDLGYESSEEARKAFDVFTQQRARYNELRKFAAVMRGELSTINKGEILINKALSARRSRFNSIKYRYQIGDSDLAKIRGKRDLSMMSTEEFNDFISKSEAGAEAIEEARTKRTSEVSRAEAQEQKKRLAYTADITERNGDVIPPEVRGGIKAPELDLTAWKDKGASSLARETMERNLEKIAPRADAEKVKKFLIEPVRDNETNRVRFNNALREEIKAKMDDFGITRRNFLKAHSGLDDRYVQIFGEGKMSIDQLMSLTKNWANVMKAADYFRDLYNNLIDQWNKVRNKYGYQPVPKRKDYFRHFADINQWTKDFGFLTNPSELPTEISGITENFKPGKQYSNAELKRLGDETSYSAIAGMDNYIDSVTSQMFGIDSIQRGRALEKYIRQAASATKGDATHKVRLPNFVANLVEYTNDLAGKSSTLDRVVERYSGRNIMKFLGGMKSRFAKNAIAGNFSSAITNFIPLATSLATTDITAATKALISGLMAPFQKGYATIDGVESKFLLRRFPIQKIDKNAFETAEGLISWVFASIDEFTSRAIVAGKYYEGINNGLTKEAAMTEADNYAGRVITDRSKGGLPIAMNSKTLGVLTQFMAEANNSVSTLYHDFSYWNQDKPKRNLKILSALLKFALFSFLFNYAYKKIRGSAVALDPIDYGLTATGLNEEGRGKPLGTRLKSAAIDLTQNLPGGSLLTSGGRFPLLGSLPDIPAVIAGTKSFTNEVTVKGLKNYFSPVGGGNQAFKSFTGIRDFLQGYHTSVSGKTQQYDIEKNIPNALRTALFGPSSVPEARQFYNNIQPEKKTTGPRLNIKGKLPKLPFIKGKLPTLKGKQLPKLPKLPVGRKLPPIK